MALKDQPFIPLYVQDIMTDEKLVECSAAAHGVYLRLICLLHKEPTYGKVKLKEKYRISDDNLVNFSEQFSGKMPFKKDAILSGLKELVNEDVVQIRGAVLSQKRMVKDGELSEKRSKSGKTGGKKTAENNAKNNELFAKAKITAKDTANTEYENEIEIVNKVAIRTEEEISREKKFCDGMLAFFGFNEINHFRNFATFYQAYRLFDLHDQTDHFMAQCESYRKYIEHIGLKYRHKFDNFIGRPDEGFANGVWNAENWTSKLAEATKSTNTSTGSSFPAYYDKDYASKLDNDRLQAYWKHCRDLGWTTQKERGVTVWVRPGTTHFSVDTNDSSQLAKNMASKFRSAS